MENIDPEEKIKIYFKKTVKAVALNMTVLAKVLLLRDTGMQQRICCFTLGIFRLWNSFYAS